MNEIILDEISAIGSFKERNRTKEFLLARDTYFLRENTTLESYFFTALRAMKAEDEVLKYVVSDEATMTGEKDVLDAPLETRHMMKEKEFFKKACNKAYIFSFVDCCDPRYEEEAERAAYLERLARVGAKIANNATAKLVCVAQIPGMEITVPDVTSLAEREYDYWLEKKERTWQEEFYYQIQTLCRNIVNQHHANIRIARVNNVFGPLFTKTDFMDVEQFCKESLEARKIVIRSEDVTRAVSSIYVVDAMKCILLVTVYGRAGHVYNVAHYNCTVKEWKGRFQEQFEDIIGVEMVNEPFRGKKYYALNSLKVRKLGWKEPTPLTEALYRTGLYYYGKQYDMKRRLSIYTGRLEKIKQIEKDTLKMVDRICQENGIQYFLAGGSLLGAIRHQDVIPWDDDLDIGMLREDFEKFRKVCPGLVEEEYVYASPQNDSKSHYHLDKVRLKNTYFATNYSNNFKINEGVFLDIIIYDQTSNHKFWQERQIDLLEWWTRVINVKWYNKPRKAEHYRKIQRWFPIIRRLPWRFVHWFFEFLVGFYKNKKHAKFLIDGIGQNIRKGAFPKEWLEKVEYVDFGDMKAPVPVGYDGYLRHFYGDKYMELLPIRKRLSGHNIARIDLAQYLFDDYTGTFRDVDIRGELFEKDK